MYISPANLESQSYLFIIVSGCHRDIHRAAPINSAPPTSFIEGPTFCLVSNWRSAHSISKSHEGRLSVELPLFKVAWPRIGRSQRSRTCDGIQKEDDHAEGISSNDAVVSYNIELDSKACFGAFSYPKPVTEPIQHCLNRGLLPSTVVDFATWLP